MMWGSTVMELAGEAVGVGQTRWEHVRRVGVVFGLTLRVLVSVMSLVRC